jgi:DNA modification methylase
MMRVITAAGESMLCTSPSVARKWDPEARAVVLRGDNLKVLPRIPAESMSLIVTSPPYNVGKIYEHRLAMARYLDVQEQAIDACLRLLKPSGSICWQVGNHVTGAGEVVPLDVLLYPFFKSRGLVLRNRIVWHFGHGLHAQRRFSGRYETVLWFTRATDDFYFDLDAVRVPQKYPGKRHYKGPKAGEYSGNPAGKNPSDFWESPADVWAIPNVKANHVEKTSHPCQFPIGLISRLVRALCPPDEWVLDPYAGVGSAGCAAVLEGRRALAVEQDRDYAEAAFCRLEQALSGTLRHRPAEKPIYEPVPGSNLTVRLGDPGGASL